MNRSSPPIPVSAVHGFVCPKCWIRLTAHSQAVEVVRAAEPGKCLRLLMCRKCGHTVWTLERVVRGAELLAGYLGPLRETSPDFTCRTDHAEQRRAFICKVHGCPMGDPKVRAPCPNLVVRYLRCPKCRPRAGRGPKGRPGKYVPMVRTEERPVPGLPARPESLPIGLRF